MMNTAIAFIVYKRPDTTRRVFETIRQARPPRLYLIADGPKTPDLESKCREVRQIVENGIDWDCELFRIYSEKNLGVGKRLPTGLDKVFAKEKKAIILEDDTLPDHTFYSYCEELLVSYEQEDSVCHISGCNFHPDVFQGNASYSVSSIINTWGWATWASAWKHFDLKMASWSAQNKTLFLAKWCPGRHHRKAQGDMFDLHCQNEDPWAWDYQWSYACWNQNGLSVVPHKNLVSNIGIGPDASNTKSDKQVALFPAQFESIEFPLVHPTIKRDKGFESRYRQKEGPTIARQFKNFLKMLKNKLRNPIIR
jgi:hypothetical protein